jgi:hypothetical protein
LGMLTFGRFPNAPDAVTDVFSPGDPDPAEAEADEEDEAAGLDELHAASARQATSETARSARRRRMKTLDSGGCSAPTAYWPKRPDTPRVACALH